MTLYCLFTVNDFGKYISCLTKFIIFITFSIGDVYNGGFRFFGVEKTWL